MPPKKPKAPKAPRRFARKTNGMGQIPAQQFLWPTMWETLQIRRRDNQAKPIQMDNGEPAIAWRAEFLIYGPDGNRASVAVPPCGGKVPASTPLSKIEQLAIETCHQALRNNGALDDG